MHASIETGLMYAEADADPPIAFPFVFHPGNAPVRYLRARRLPKNASSSGDWRRKMDADFGSGLVLIIFGMFVTAHGPVFRLCHRDGTGRV